MIDEHQIIKDAYAVLLPAFADLTLSDSVKSFLKKGGCSILLGENRAEYVNRTMSDIRIENETGNHILETVEIAKQLQPNLIVAIDQEIVGINRLHHLVSDFPSSDDLKEMDLVAFKMLCAKIATQAKQFGINCFLAPILDLVTGKNPWLQGRTWSTNSEEVSNITSTFIKGVQQSKVIATAKHFPGFSNILLDPAINEHAVMDSSIQQIKENLIPFAKAIESNVEMIMVGPAIVKAIDPIYPAGLSNKIIALLKNEINFKGIILSDDLDAKATLQNNTIESVAVQALQAGCDYLLLADIDDQVHRVAKAIQKAVLDNKLSEKQLNTSANKIRKLAIKYNS